MSNKLKKQNISKAFKKHAKYCHAHGFELYAALCLKAARAIYSNIKLDQLFSIFADDESYDIKQFLSAIHALQISQKTKNIDVWYRDDYKDYTDLWPQIAIIIDENFEFIKNYMRIDSTPNRVGRAAIILAAINEISDQYKLPICLYELDAKAGFNLYFDQYGYEIAGQNWSKHGNKCKIKANWQGVLPAFNFNFNSEFNIAERHGCDVAPLDLEDKLTVLRLNAAVPADQYDIKLQSEQAIDLIRKSVLDVDKSDGLTWIINKIKHLKEGHLHFIFHMVAWQLMSDDLKNATLYTIENAQKFATPNCPIIHLSFEYNKVDGQGDVLLRIWDGDMANGEVVLLGCANEKGDFISWNRHVPRH